LDRRFQIEAVRKVQEYIQTHLKEPMTLHEIACAAGYSPWHISRIFKEYSGKTIFEYIRSVRLSEAAIELRDHETAVVDVAFDFIFDSHEGFTRAFSREFGITPKKYSMQKPPIKLFRPYPVNDPDSLTKGTKKMNEPTNIVFAQVIERSKRKALIKRGVSATEYFQYCEEVGCDVWGELCSIKEALYEPMGMWLPPKLIKSGTSVYVQGVELPDDYSGIVPEGYDLIDLEPCKMMIFQGPKYDDEDFRAEVSKVMVAIKHYDPIAFGFMWADDQAPRFQYEPRGERGYIEGRPVKEIVQ
jgi:AraC-like DNA-binding protein